MAKLENLTADDLSAIDDLMEPAWYEAHMHDEWPQGEIDGKDFDRWHFAAQAAVVNDDREAFEKALANMKALYRRLYRERYGD